MSDVIDRFCKEKHNYDDISPGRRRMQAKVLRELEASCGDILSAGGAEVQAYLSTLVERDFHPNTVRKYLGAIRPFFTWAWTNKLIGADPLLEVRALRPPRGSTNEGRPRPYSRDQLARFWRELDKTYPWAPRGGPRTRERGARLAERYFKGQSEWKRARPYARRLQVEAIVWLALAGGLRRDEIFRLEVDDMVPEGEYIVVHGARKNAHAEEAMRAVPWVTDEMRAAVADWLAFRARLAPPHSGAWLSLYYEDETRENRMRHKKFENVVGRIGAWEFHRLRHTAATEMLRGGMPLENVSRILGHARIQQTLAYARILPSDLVKAAAQVQSDVSRALRPDEEAA